MIVKVINTKTKESYNGLVTNITTNQVGHHVVSMHNPNGSGHIMYFDDWSDLRIIDADDSAILQHKKQNNESD